MSRPVGRPPLPYATRHVMINMRMEYYMKMKRAKVNISKMVNDFLHAEHNYTICPICYSHDIHVRHCAKCDGRALFCDALDCKTLGASQKWECLAHAEPCSAREFRGKPGSAESNMDVQEG